MLLIETPSAPALKASSISFRLVIRPPAIRGLSISFFIAVITFVGGIIYMPLIFVSAAGFFTGVLLRVLKNVMYSAIELKQDNDLTI